MRVLDLFAGAGGWDIAAHRLGMDVDRVEIWKPARVTAAVNGMRTMHDDVTIPPLLAEAILSTLIS